MQKFSTVFISDFIEIKMQACLAKRIESLWKFLEHLYKVRGRGLWKWGLNLILAQSGGAYEAGSPIIGKFSSNLIG